MPSVASLLVRIDATTENLRRELAKADSSVKSFADKTDRQIGGIDARFAELGRGLQGALGGLGLAFGGMELAQGFIRMSDAATNMENRLKTVTGSAAELKGVQDLLYASSQNNSVAMDTQVELFTRISRALDRTGISAERVVEITDTLGKATQLSGATTAEAAAAMHQLSQAFNNGRLMGEEFNTMADTMPLFLDAVAREMAKINGTTFDEARSSLKDMAADSEISLEVLVNAAENMRDGTVDAFSEMGDTTEKAVTRMWNALTRFIGKLDDVTGASDSVSGRISAFGGVLDWAAGVVDAYGGSLSGLLNIINSIPTPLETLIGIAKTAHAELAKVANLAVETAAKAQGNIDAARRQLVPESAELDVPQSIGQVTTESGRPVMDSIPDILKPTANVLSGGAVSGFNKDVVDWFVSEEMQKAVTDLDKNIRGARETLKPKNAAPTSLPPEAKPELEHGPSAKDIENERKANEKAAKEATKERDRQLKEAERLRANLRTPQEKREATVSDLGERLKFRQIDKATYERGVKDADEDMNREIERAEKRARGPKAKKTEEEKEHERAVKEGKSVFEDSRTAAEAYAAEIDRLGQLLADKAITQETYNRAVRDLGIEMTAGQTAFTAGQDAAAAYNAEIARLKQELAAGNIVQDEYNILVGEAQGRYAESIQNAGAYANEVARLDKALADGAISQEEHAASLEIAKEQMEANTEAVDAGRAVYESTRTPIERYGEEIERLNSLLAQGAISQDTHSRAVNDAMDKLDSDIRDLTGATMELDKMGEDMGMTFASAFEDAIIAGKGFKGILDGLLEDLQRIVLRTLVTQPIANALTMGLNAAMGVGPMAPRAGSTAGIGAAQAGNMGRQMSAIRGFAEGGWINGPGSDKSDSIMARLSPGEFVVPARVARANRKMLESLPQYAKGGWIEGEGSDTSDNILARLSPGEYVVPAKVARMNRTLLESLPRYATGGFVGPAPSGHAGNIHVTVENKAAIPMKAESATSTRNPMGDTEIKVMINSMVKDAMRGGEYDQTLGRRYGVSQQPIGR